MDIPAAAVRGMVSRAVHIVVYAGELADHSRKVMEIIEVAGLDYSASASLPPYKTRTLYRFEFDHYNEASKAVGRFIVSDPPSWIDQLKRLPNFTMPDFWQPIKETQQ